MKKPIVAILAVLSAAAVSVGAWAIADAASGTGATSSTTPEIEETLAKGVSDGKDFLQSTAKPAAGADETAKLAFDGDDSTAWTAPTNKGAVLQYDFDKLTTLNIVRIKEEGKHVRYFRILAWDGKDWQQVYCNDLIEGYHQSVLKKPIMTYAIRLVIDEMDSESTLAKIKTIEVDAQQKIALDNRFVNMAYMTGCSFVQDWDPVEPQKMATFTDVTMIGNFLFDKDGKFQLAIEAPSGYIDHVVLPTSEEGKTETKRWIEAVKGYSGDNAVKPNLWFSLTCLKETESKENGQPLPGVPNGWTDVFNNDTIRAQFISDIVAYAKNWGFVGIDVDWEYPHTASEWQAYGKLITDLSVALKAEGLYMSTAQSAGTGLTTEQLNLFDRVNIMAYDSVGATMGQHATFNSTAVDLLKYFINTKGVAKEKIILGLPWYADKLGDANIQTDWKYIYGLLYKQGKGKIDEGLNSIGGYGFNGPNLLRDKVVYALQNQIGGIFCWQVKNDFEYTHQYSIARLVQETLDQYSYVKK